MDPTLILQIVSYISLAITAAEDLKPAVQDAIAFIDGLFGAKLITVDQQDALKAYIDAATLAFIKDEAPPAWTVEPDPVT